MLADGQNSEIELHPVFSRYGVVDDVYEEFIVCERRKYMSALQRELRCDVVGGCAPLPLHQGIGVSEWACEINHFDHRTSVEFLNWER
jgi:hypothetical protein